MASPAPSCPPASLSRVANVALVLGVLCLLACVLYALNLSALDAWTGLDVMLHHNMTKYLIMGALSTNFLLLLGLAVAFVMLKDDAVRHRLQHEWHASRSWVTSHVAMYWTGLGLLSLAYGWGRLQWNIDFEYATLEMLTQGEAYAPFQYRALIPWLIAQLVALLPILGNQLGTVYLLVEAAACFGVLYVSVVYLQLFFKRPGSAHLLVAAVFFALICTMATPYRGNNFYYPYDTPSIIVMTLGLWLLHQRRWGWYYLLFVLGTVNRETTCFLTMAYVCVAFREVPLRTIALHVVAQFVLWFAIKNGVQAAYPGLLLVTGEPGVFENQLLRNLHLLSHPHTYLYMPMLFGALWLPLVLLPGRLTNGYLKRVLGVCVPFFLGMFIVGLIQEVRIFGELIPVIVPAALMKLRNTLSTLHAPQPELVAA